MRDEIIEKKKKWLYRYRNNSEKISRIQDKLLTLEARITSIKSPNYSGMPRGSSPVTISDLLSDKEELEKRIERLEETGRKYRREILEAIDTLEDSKHADVLERWFILGYSADQIGEAIGYSTRYIFVLYSDALREIVLPGTTEN